MASPGPEYDRRSSDRQTHLTGSLESLAARATVGAPTLYRVFSGIGSVASTVILALIGLAWSEVRTEWKELKETIADIRHELDRQPSPEEFEKLRERVEQINERLIRMEAYSNQWRE
jgi:hypothetical protein